nr:hypothetical protein [Tanacetum cinerariifolium]
MNNNGVIRSAKKDQEKSPRLGVKPRIKRRSLVKSLLGMRVRKPHFNPFLKLSEKGVGFIPLGKGSSHAYCPIGCHCKSIDTHEGTGLKPGVLDVSKTDSSESEYESWGDSGDEANIQETNDDKEESDDEFVHTPPNYVPTHDETNDESNDVNEEKYDRIDKELYGDVNVSLTDVEQDDRDEEDANMTDAPHNATTKVPSFSSSHSVLSSYTSAFLNPKNLQSTKTEVVSMLDINVQHEVPCTSLLLTILVSVIPEHTVFNPSKTVTTALTTTVTSLLSSLFLTLPQSIPIPTLTNIEATTSTPTVLKSKTLNVIHLRLSDMEKEVNELKNVDHSSTLFSTIKSEVPNAVKEYLGISLDDALYKML